VRHDLLVVNQLVHRVQPVYDLTLLTYSMESSGVKSGDLGGQAVGTPLPHMLINTWQ
jgi:hypothetical protein